MGRQSSIEGRALLKSGSQLGINSREKPGLWKLPDGTEHVSDISLRDLGQSLAQGRDPKETASGFSVELCLSSLQAETGPQRLRKE